MTRSYGERPVQFGPDRSLFGVLCLSSEERRGGGPVVVMLNGGLIHRAGANRIHVLIARALARQGVHSLRFDLSGIGDSERRSGSMSLDEAVRLDVEDALGFLEERHGADSFVLLGLCSGAYDSLRLAESDPRVVGVVAIDVFGAFRNFRHLVVHYAPRIFRADVWRRVLSRPLDAVKALLGRLGGVESSDDAANVDRAVRPAFSHEELDDVLVALRARGGRALFVFTAGLEDNYNYRHQFRDCYPEHVRSGDVAYEYFPQSNHTFASPSSRSALVDAVSGWLADTRFPAARASSATGEETGTLVSP